MSKFTKKTLLISGAILLSLSIGGTGISQIANHYETPVSANRTSQYQNGLRTGQKDAQIFYKDLATNYIGTDNDDSMSVFLTVALTYHHAPLNNRKYQAGYLKGYHNYAKQTRYTKKSHRKYSYRKEFGFMISNQNYQQAIREIHFIRRQPNAKTYYAGYVDNLIDASGGFNNSYAKSLGLTPNSDNLPKKYRNNVAFAKGYLLGNINSVYNKHGLNDLFGSNQYENYLSKKGHVSYKKFLDKHYQKLYNLYWKVTVHDEHNALTKAQGMKYDKYINKKYHLTKADQKFMNYLYNNVTLQNIYTDDNIFGTGRYIWNNVGFASNLRKKAPFTMPTYFSRYVVNGESGDCLDKSTLSGYIIGLKNDNTKSARQTAKAFKTYVNNTYARHPNKKLARQFKKSYGIKTLAKSPIVTGHKIYHSENVSIYHIYNKHAKRSTVSFYMPAGRGPIGFEPEVEG